MMLLMMLVSVLLVLGFVILVGVIVYCVLSEVLLVVGG